MENKMNPILENYMWELFNDYSVNGVMIISHEKFKSAIQRINWKLLTENHEGEKKDGN